VAVGGPRATHTHLASCKRNWHGSKAEKTQGSPKGPPPDAVHMSSKLVGPEPVQNTQNRYLQQQTPKMKHSRESVGPTPRGSDARDDMEELCNNNSTDSCIPTALQQPAFQ